MERSFRRLYHVPVWLLVLLFVANDGWAQVILSGDPPCPGSPLNVTSSRPIRIIEWLKNDVPFDTVTATWQGITLAGGKGDGAGPDQLDSALAMFIDVTGNIYVSDLNNHRVLKFAAGNAPGSPGVIVAGGMGAGVGLNQLHDPAGIFVDVDGNLYVADMGNHRVLKFPKGSVQGANGVVVAGGSGLGQGLNQFNSPISVYVDGTGKLYVADRDNHRVLRYTDANGTNLTGAVVAGNGTNGPGLNQLDQPVSITMHNGRLLVSEYRNHRVTSWDPEAPMAGILVAGITGDYGARPDQLRSPAGISVDAAGQLYIADSDNDRIVSWTLGPVPAITGVAQIDNGRGAGPDQLDRPLAVYRIELNAFIVLDLLNNRVQKFTPAIVSTYTPTEAGAYHVIITHDDGSKDTSDAFIIQPTHTPTVSITPTAVSVCPGTSATFTAAVTHGGTAPQFTWTVNNVDQGEKTAVFKPALVHAGDAVSVTIQTGDDAGCLTTTTASSSVVTVALHPQLDMKAIEGATSVCLNGSVTLSNPTIKDTYTWASLSPTVATIDPVSGVVRGVGAGTATIKYYASSAEGCTDSIAANITVAALITSTVTIQPTAAAACQGKLQTFTAVGSNTGSIPGYSWLVNGVSAGVSASSFSADTLANNAVIQVVMTPDADVGCRASTTVTSVPLTVIVHPLPVVAPIIGGNFLCNKDILQLSNGTAGISGVWKSLNEAVAVVDATGKVSGISDGQSDIWFIATTTAGCVDSVKTLMTVGPLVTPSFTVTPSATSVCAGKEIRFMASSTQSGSKPSYSWQVNGAPAGVTDLLFTRSDLQPGDVVTCVLTPSSDAGCMAKASFESTPIIPTINSLPAMAPITGLFEVCLHSRAQLSTNSAGGAWKSLAPTVASIDATGSVLGRSTGTALIRYISTTVAGCKDSVQTTMTVRSLYTPTLSVSASAKAVCQGNPVTFTAHAGPAGNDPQFEWFLNNAATGSTGISYTNSNLQQGDVVHVVMTPSQDAGCVSSPTINSMAVMVTVGQPPVMKPITGNTVLCSGATTQLTNATTGVAASWHSLNTAVVTVSPTGLVSGVGAGTSVVRYVGTTTIGCRDSVDVSVTVNASVVPSLMIDANRNDTCTGVAILFTAQAGQGGSQPTYQWQVNGQPAGAGVQWSSTTLRNGDVVRCVLTSNATCALPVSTNSNEIVMRVHALPRVSAGPDKTILRSEPVVLEGSVSDDVTSIRWSPATGLQNAGTATPVASPFSTTRYLLEAATAKGCHATDEVTVSVIETVKVPNAFSPNGDGVHDTWEIPDLGYAVQVEIQVFNRQGQQVYVTSSYQRGKGWNGTYKGYVLPAGTYYYVIDLKNGKPKLSGTITLLK